MTFIGFSKVKWLEYTGKVWANVQAVDVKFFQDLTYHKSLKSVNFLTELFEKNIQSYLKNRKVDVFWDTVYITAYMVLVLHTAAVTKTFGRTRPRFGDNCPPPCHIVKQHLCELKNWTHATVSN